MERTTTFEAPELLIILEAINYFDNNTAQDESSTQEIQDIKAKIRSTLK